MRVGVIGFMIKFNFWFWMFVWGFIILFLALVFQKTILSNNPPAFTYFQFFLDIIIIFIYLGIFLRYDSIDQLMKMKYGRLASADGSLAHFNYQKKYLSVFECKNSWIDKDGIAFSLSLNDSDYGEENKKRAYETIKSVPWFFWSSKMPWLFISVTSLMLQFIYNGYLSMNDSYLQTGDSFEITRTIVTIVLPLLSLVAAVLCLITQKKQHDCLYALTKQVVEEHVCLERIVKSERAEQLNKGYKWYYNICPKCGAEADRDRTSCACCGALLEVQAHENDVSTAIHRISTPLYKDSNTANEHFRARPLKAKYHSSCPSCGSARKEDEKVCSFCGKSLLAYHVEDYPEFESEFKKEE